MTMKPSSLTVSRRSASPGTSAQPRPRVGTRDRGISAQVPEPVPAAVLSLHGNREVSMPPPPLDRGRFLSIEDVGRIYYRGTRSRWWILRNFAPEFRIKQGRKVYWWELDCNEWLDSLRKAGKRKAAS